MMRLIPMLVMICLACCTVRAQNSIDAIVYPGGGPAQTETDEYTRYELLAPETASFRIYYEVTATTAGARYSTTPSVRGASQRTKA